MSTQYFDLIYNVSNLGDGSVSVNFFETKKDAEKDEEGMSEGWGEPSVDSVKLKIEDGILYYQSYDCIDEENYKFEYRWHKVPRAKK